MGIRFSIGGNKKSNKPKTEASYYMSAAWCILAEIIYFFRLTDGGSLRIGSSSSMVFLPFFIIFTVSAVLNIIKGIKMTRKRLTNRFSPENKRETGYIYCTQCGCKLLEGIQVCPYCNEPILPQETYESARKPSFNEASPEVKEKPNILLILSIIALITSAVVLMIYNVSNPYAKMETDELYLHLEEKLLDTNINSLTDIDEIVAELESRELPEKEELRKEVDEVYDIVQNIYAIGFPATNEEGQALRDGISLLILFDEEHERWDLSKEIATLTTNRAKDLLVGTEWQAGKRYFKYFYSESGKRVMVQNVATKIIPPNKVFQTLVTLCEDGTVDVSYENVDDKTEVYQSLIIKGIHYDTKMGHWAIEVYVPTYDSAYIMTETGVVQ